MSEAEHQQEVDGGVEDDEAVGDGRVHLQPAGMTPVGPLQRRVDGVEDEAEQRHGAADGEHKHDDDRKSRGAQLTLLRRVERHPVAPGIRQGRHETQVEDADYEQRNGVDDDAVHGGVVAVSVDLVVTQTRNNFMVTHDSAKQSYKNIHSEEQQAILD